MSASRVTAALAAILGTGALAWWIWTDRTSPAPTNTSPAAVEQAAPPFSLSARLVIEPAGPGAPALGIVRIFDVRARNGFTTGSESVALSRASIDARVALEIESPNGVTAGAKPTVVKAPQDGMQRLRAQTTIELWVDLPTLPAAGSRVRVSLPIGNAQVLTDWVEVPAAPSDGVDALVARARVQRAKGDPALAATADELVAAAPGDARGYYYRGLALEARGDRTGAIAAYEAALERMPDGGPEPPEALYRRLARLQSGAR